MAKFHSIRVADVYRETKDCSVITFEIPADLRQEFAFRHGQHLTFKKEIGGQEVRRSYSLCTTPSSNVWRVAVKRINDGLFSSFVHENLKAGDTLEVMPPTGVFGVPVDATKPRHFVFFAAGSGITPILSILKTHLEQEPQSTAQLFYLNRSVKSIIFKEEIEQLKNVYFNRFEAFHFLTKEHRNIPLFNGRFTHEKLQTLTRTLIDVPSVDACFICGPEDMIFLIRDELTAAGLERSKIHFELFNTGHSAADRQRTERALEKRVDGTQVTIIDGGKEFHFVMDDDFDNILDGALAAGADLPFACKGGVCSTCKCRVVEGSVEMKINYALDENEVAQNLVLSCQAVPTSGKVVVDFAV